MNSTRRQFLQEASSLGSIALFVPQSASFRGRNAGEARDIDGIPVAWCPPGRFTMGSPPSEPGRGQDEAQVQVNLTRGFWAGKFEVTQGQWTRVVGQFPDRLPSARFGLGDDVPAYWISFTEAEAFCAEATRRAVRAGAIPAAWEFRLPTEAQWEYACRAGTITLSAFGPSLDQHQANFAENPAARAADAVGSSKRVGSYPANAWGLHDMHGNVWEWCRDWYHAQLPGGTDPGLYDVPGVMNRDGTYSRVRRGGAWIESRWDCRSARRLRYEPPRRSDHIGFRIVVVER